MKRAKRLTRNRNSKTHMYKKTNNNNCSLPVGAAEFVSDDSERGGAIPWVVPPPLGAGVRLPARLLPPRIPRRYTAWRRAGKPPGPPGRRFVGLGGAHWGAHEGWRSERVDS